MLIAPSAPAEVATPRPPVKPMKSDQLWPTIAATPAAAAAHSTSGSPANRSRASSTAATPLPTSSRKTAAAAGVPSVRSAFVAPVRCDPYSRRSIPFVRRPMISPNGMAPSR